MIYRSRDDMVKYDIVAVAVKRLFPTQCVNLFTASILKSIVFPAI